MSGRQNVMVMAEPTPLDGPETQKKYRQYRYFKAKVPTGHKADGVHQAIGESLDEKSVVSTDKSTPYYGRDYWTMIENVYSNFLSNI